MTFSSVKHLSLSAIVLFVVGIGFGLGAKTVQAATSTVCALGGGCDYETLGGPSGALANAATGDVIAIESTYTSTTEPSFPWQFSNSGVTVDCQNNSTLIGSTSTNMGALERNLFYLHDDTTIRNCQLGDIILGTGSSRSGITIRDNTFHPEIATSTISFDNGASNFSILNNTNVGAFGFGGLGAASSNGTIQGNTFYFKPRSGTNTVSFSTVAASTGLTITGNTFSFYGTNGIGTSPVTLAGDGIQFATNTIRFVEPQDDTVQYSMYVKPGDGGSIYVGGNSIASPATTTCVGIYVYPYEGAVPEGDVTFLHNTVRLNAACGPSFFAGGSAGLVVNDNGTASTIFSIIAKYNSFSNAGATSTSGNLVGFSHRAQGSGSSITVTEDYNGYFGFKSNVTGDDGMDVALGSNSRTDDPMFQIADNIPTNDMDLVPFSNYLDVNGTLDIGATNAVRRSTITIDVSLPEVDYMVVDATSTADINTFIRSGDTITLAAGSYDAFSVSSTRATTGVTITGAGNSTVVTASTGDAIRLSGITTSTLSGVRVTGAGTGAATYSVTKLLYSYMGTAYTQSDLDPVSADPNSMLYWRPGGCEIGGTASDGLDITSLTSGGTVSFNVALADVGGVKVTVLVPADSIPNAAALEADCGGMVTVDQFIDGVFVPTGGVYAYDSSAVVSASATLVDGLTSPALTRTQTQYAGIRLANAAGWTIDQVTSTNNALGIAFEGTTVSSTVRDSVITSSDNYDVYTSAPGVNYLDNTSFDRTSVSVDDSSAQLLIKFRARAYVTDEADAPLTGATATATDGSDADTSLGTTSSGYTSYARLPAYLMTSLSSSLTNGGYNPYTIAVTASGYTASSSPAFNLSSPNQTVTIAMAEASSAPSTPSAPTVGVISRTALTIAIPADANPISTEYAIYSSTRGQYLASNGSFASAPTWQTSSTWGTLTVADLTCGNTYAFATIARNESEVESATSTATTVAMQSCSSSSSSGGSGGGGGGGGGGAVTTFFTPAPSSSVPPVSTPVSSEPTPNPAPSVPTNPVPAPQPAQQTLADFLAQGGTAASRALGSGERAAVLRDAQETMQRPGSEIPVDDLERIANGQIPRTRNLAYERSMVPRALATFRTIFGHAPNFQNERENLAWNTMMYRIRFPRDLTAERSGIAAFRRTFGSTPQSPFQWAVVRVLGYL